MKKKQKLYVFLFVIMFIHMQNKRVKFVAFQFFSDEIYLSETLLYLKYFWKLFVIYLFGITKKILGTYLFPSKSPATQLTDKYIILRY